MSSGAYRAQDTEELIRALQQTLIPPAPPVRAGPRRRRGVPPAQGEVGGDFYDVFEVAEGDWCAVLGDVSGKGVEAAIVTSTARHAVRSWASASGAERAQVTVLNTALLEKGSRGSAPSLCSVCSTNGRVGGDAHLGRSSVPVTRPPRHGDRRLAGPAPCSACSRTWHFTTYRSSSQPVMPWCSTPTA